MARQPYTLPNGFVFPHFPYTEQTLVRIKDLTNYREAVEIENKNTFNQIAFDHYFDEESMLELEIEPFLVMLKTSTLKKLGVKQPPEGWTAFHEECFWMKEEEEPLVWTETKQIHKHLHQLGLLVELPPTKEMFENHLYSITAVKLKEICKNHGIKVTGSKDVLINNLINHVKIKIPTFITISEKYGAMLRRLAQAYIQDVEKQLEKKPEIYRKAINFLLQEDEYLQAAL